MVRTHISKGTGLDTTPHNPLHRVIGIYRFMEKVPEIPGISCTIQTIAPTSPLHTTTERQDVIFTLQFMYQYVSICIMLTIEL